MEDLTTTFHPKHFIEESGPHPDHSDEKKCIICEKLISFRLTCFYCRECNFYFHKECPSILMKSNLTIDHPETHEHALTFIRKKNTFRCDACSYPCSQTENMNMYACLPCNFFIHRNCIYLPKVIKLTRHSHRLFHTFQVYDQNTCCEICHSSFEWGYGWYICTEKTCDYKLHSDCATHKDVWDGKDVKGEREEISNSEDVTFSSLEEVDDNTFHHVSHHHDLVRLYVNDKEEDDERICQACILHIDFDSFLSCKECDFALHEICARLPRKLEHAFHVHLLALEVNIKEGFFTCSKCERESCGIMYRCCQEECEFKIDAKCASLADPSYKGVHKHTLTLLDSGVCCYECDFEVETKRAALPMLVKCKYDTHPLTLCFVREISWCWSSLCCEICEVRIQYGYYTNYQEFYGCADCNTIVHVDCAIGKYPYLKPGRTIKVNGFEIEIASNSLSRPICHACHCICQDKLVFKDKRDSVFFCSIKCVTSSSKTCLQS